MKGIKGGVPPIPDVPITMDNTYPVTCDCGHNVFNIGLLLRRVSALLAPTPEPTFVQIQTFYCVKCGAVYEDATKVETKPATLDDET